MVVVIQGRTLELRRTSHVAGQGFLGPLMTSPTLVLCSSPMKHDESALVKQALQDAREQLQRKGKILPAAYMLVSNNPQTGAPLTYPTAIGSVRDEPFKSQDEYEAFIAMLRGEVARLGAVAVALTGEAKAEIETSRGVEMRRVFYVRMEDLDGVEQLHAPIDGDANGHAQLGKLLADAGASDVLSERLLAMTSGPGRA